MANLPEELLLGEIELTDDFPRVFSDSQSRIYRVRRLTGHRHEFKCKSIPFHWTKLKAVRAKINRIVNDNGFITMTAPIYSHSEKSTTTATQLREVGETSINVANSADIAEGDFFKFNGHTKVYTVDRIDGNTLHFTPNLMRQVANTETLTFNNVEFTLKPGKRLRTYNMMGGNQNVVIELDLIETI